MAYSVDIIYSKNQDFSNPLTETEAGQPQSVELTNLDSNETYYTKAVLKNNGTVEDESTVETFATLPAGTIALTHQSSARQGGDYVVVYTYTSTYALSSSVLRCGATIAAQGVISGNTITYTVSGLTPGDAYIYDITTIDIYAETNNITGSLVMPVVNIVAISLQEALADEISFDLDYTVDSGMVSGYLNYWLGSDDPSTDQPQGHFHFSYGDDTCTVSGLTLGTSYKFRATIVLGDGTTEIVSNVVTAATVDNTDYLYIQNTDSNEQVFQIVKHGTPSTGTDLSYSFDKRVWSFPQYDNIGYAQITLQSGEKMYLRSSTGLSQSNSAYYSINSSRSTPFTAGGNLLSVIDYTNIGSISSIPNYGCCYMFYSSGITEANVFGEIKTIGDYGCYYMFHNSHYITNVGSPQKIKTVKDHGCYCMFKDCRSLTSPLPLNVVTTAYPYAFYSMYYDCESLLRASDLNGLTEINPYTCGSMYVGCISIVSPPEMKNVRIINTDGLGNTFYGCTSLTAGVNLKNVTGININAAAKTYGIMGCCYAGCTSLKTAYAPNVSNLYNTNEDVLYGWLTNVSNSGTAYKNRNATFLSGNSGLPSGWSSRNYS